MHLSTAVLASAGMLCCTLSGCGLNGSGSNVPTVSRQALQEDISQRLAEAGEKPQAVTCNQDLIGEVGTTVRCEVVISATNRFEPIVTVAGVDGAAIDYEMTPAVSRQQLEDVVWRLVADAGTVDVTSVSCETGIEGTVGDDRPLRCRCGECAVAAHRRGVGRQRPDDESAGGSAAQADTAGQTVKLTARRRDRRRWRTRRPPRLLPHR